MEINRINRTEPEFENKANEATIPFSMKQEAAIAVIEEMISTISHQLQSNPPCVITGPIKEKIIADIMDAFKQGRFVEPQINSFSGKSAGCQKEVDIMILYISFLSKLKSLVQTLNCNNPDFSRNKINHMIPDIFVSNHVN